MKKMKGFSLFVMVSAAIWLFAVFSNSQAQRKGPEKDKNKNEREADKENSSGNNAAMDRSQAARISKNKYKPRGISDKNMTEWADGNPPGWSEGNKAGWGGAGVPPGQMKERELELIHSYPSGSEDWDSGKKADWRSNLEQSKTRILERIRTRKGVSREDEESAIISIERAAREGVPLTHIESVMNKAITREMRSRDIEKMTRAMSYGADKNTDYDKLDRFIERKMDQGETGDDLAVSIYREIDERNVAKSEEPVRKSWWKRLFGG